MTEDWEITKHNEITETIAQLSIVTVDINGLNLVIKIQSGTSDLKTDFFYAASKKHNLSPEINTVYMKRWEKSFPAPGTRKQEGLIIIDK